MKNILVELIKPLLEEIIAYIDANNYWAAYGSIIGFVVILVIIGYSVSWILSKKKLQKEIEKLSVESKEKLITLLEKLQEKRNEYIRQSEYIQLSVKLCTESLINQNKTSLEKNRDELIDLFFNELINDFVQYIEVCEIFYKGEKHKITACIIDDILPFFETTKTFMSVVNNKNILSVLEKEGVKLKKFSLNPVIRFTSDNISFYQLILRHKIKRVINDIKFETT